MVEGGRIFMLVVKRQRNGQSETTDRYLGEKIISMLEGSTTRGVILKREGKSTLR